MNVYGEILFAENAVMGGVILYITALISEKLFGSRGYVFSGKGKIKIALGSVMCGAFSFVIFIPAVMELAAAAEAGFAFFVCFLVLGKNILWKKVIVFILVTYSMGGITMALLLITKNSGMYTMTGIYTGDMKAGMLALFTGISLFAAKKTVEAVSRRKFYREHVFDAVIHIENMVFDVKAFLDTGNSLKEPVRGLSVAVASDELWKRLETSGAVKLERICVIPYETVKSRGIFEAVRIDYMMLNGRKCSRCAVAKGDGDFKVTDRMETGIECGLLLSRDMICSM